MEFEELHEENEHDLGREVVSIYESKKTLIYALHVHINQFELHLDTITNKYKSIALLWLLASFVAIGFIFSTETKELQIDRLISASIISLFGMIGISSLWYIDMSTFQKFWGAFFIESVKMGNKYHFLLNVGDVSLRLDTVKSRIIVHENIYILSKLLLLITGGIALVLFFESNILKIITSVFLLALALLIIQIMRKLGLKLEKTIEVLLRKKV